MNESIARNQQHARGSEVDIGSADNFSHLVITGNLIIF